MYEKNLFLHCKKLDIFVFTLAKERVFCKHIVQYRFFSHSRKNLFYSQIVSAIMHFEEVSFAAYIFIYFSYIYRKKGNYDI